MVILDVRVLITLCNDLVMGLTSYLVVGLMMLCHVLFEPSWTCLFILNVVGFVVAGS